MNMKTRTLKPILTTLTMLGLILPGTAQEKPAAETPAPPPETVGEKVDQFFNGKIPDAIAKGKFSLNVRLRYENADAANTVTAHAFTLRPRFGFTTAPVYGFQAMIEGENVSSLLGNNEYNAAGANAARAKGAAIVADPPTTELNQAWLSFSKWDSTLKGGRQRIVLDNHRFVGDVGWRQNMQTFDAVTLESKHFKDFTFFYGYLWEVNRVFGNVTGLPAANLDFKSDSHLVNISYTGCPYAKLSAYTYLLDVQNAAANSSATYGLSLSGAYTFDKDKNAKVSYRAEYAHQTDYRNQPLNYDANYYLVEVGGDYDRFNAGGGYEILTSDGGAKGFSTPLATLHAFNGWDDIFLATPATGLRDAYLWAGVKLPYNVPLKVIYHKYDADFGSAHYGHEWDAVISRAFGKNWTAMVKYATFSGSTGFFNTSKLWAQVEFNF